jgi:hypothetical protein
MPSRAKPAKKKPATKAKKPAAKAKKKPKPSKKKIPPPASKPAWLARDHLVRRGPIVLSPEVHQCLAGLRYVQLLDKLGEDEEPSVDDAPVAIDGQRIEAVFQELGPLPYSLVAAWAAAGEVPYSEHHVSETFSPEGALAATGEAFDLRGSVVPDGFVAIEFAGVRGEYVALVNDALGGANGVEIVTVQFEASDARPFDLSDRRTLTQWLRWMYMRTDPPFQAPAAFAAAFRVTIE